MAQTYTNYRWEKSGRGGNRFHYKRDISWAHHLPRKPDEEIVATVTYEGNHKSQYWGKWVAQIHPLSPALDILRVSDIPKFNSKNDAIAWVTAMVRLSI